MRKALTRAAAIAAGPVLALALAAGAASASTQNVSFAGGYGGSAHWSKNIGSPIVMTIGSSQSTRAVIELHGVAGDLPAAAPTFNTDSYKAGSPRWYITLSNGDYLFGYPELGDVWETHGSVAGYTNWAGVQAAEAGAQVTGVFVVADADQAPGTVDTVTGLTYNGMTYN